MIDFEEKDVCSEEITVEPETVEEVETCKDCGREIELNEERCGRCQIGQHHPIT